MFLHKRNKYWYIHFVDYNGKRQKVSTKTTNRLIAEKILKEFSLGINSPNSFTNTLNSPNQNSVFLKDFSNRILEYANINFTSKNFDLYQRVLKNLYQLIGNKNIFDINFNDIEKYKALRANEVSKSSVNIELRTIKAIFNIAKDRWEILDKNPAKNIQQFSIPEKEKLSLNFHEVKEFLNNVDDNKFKNVVLFALNTGCRASEIINLEWNDIDIKNRIITIRNKPTFKTKTGRIRQIPINEQVLSLLNNIILKFHNCNCYVFLNQKGNQYRRDFLTYKFKKTIRRCKLPLKYHFHCLRHTFITALIKQNVSISKVMKLAGHSDVDTTLGYTHLNVEDLRDSVKMIHF